MLLFFASRSLRSAVTPIGRHSLSSAGPSPSGSSFPRQFKVLLDNDTLYIDQSLAEALGWTPGTSAKGVPLTLSGWAPNYFAIAQSGSDSDLLARGTVESSTNPRVHQVLDYLKDR
ncbi:hypothetical protein OF83DRAFT_1057801 [Amylostereum chailletii]|nr:hypothetical protein OF83DRAFT_1057801 [Amylostereum chailletii]